MKQQSVRKKMRSAILVACAAWLIYAGAFAHMYFLEGVIATERKEVDSLKRQQEQAIALRAVKSDVKNNVELLQGAVITESERVSALEYVERLAQTYAQQAVLQRVEEQPAGNPAVVKFTLAAQGNWRQMYTLLRKIEMMRYIASVDKVELEKFATLGTLSQVDDRYGDAISVGPQSGFGAGWRMTMELSVLTEAQPGQAADTAAASAAPLGDGLDSL